MLLPGSGSDEVFIRAAFAGPLHTLGIRLLAPAPAPGTGVVDGYLRALEGAVEDAAREEVSLLVGGVSLGAQVAIRWTIERWRGPDPGGPVGVLAALPAWTGEPHRAPAAVAATTTATAVRRNGLAATIDHTRRGTPGWLGAELARAWRRYGDGLAASLEAAATASGPTEFELAGCPVPVGLVGLADDPIHPLEVAERWHAVLPRSALVTSTLSALGADRATLGRAAVLAWLRACGAPVTPDRPGRRADADAPPGAAGPG